MPAPKKLRDASCEFRQYQFGPNESELTTRGASISEGEKRIVMAIEKADREQAKRDERLQRRLEGGMMP